MRGTAGVRGTAGPKRGAGPRKPPGPPDRRVVNRSRDLLDRAELLFDDAASVEDDGAERFRLFYLAAIRAAGAILAVHEPLGPVRRRGGARDAWSRIAAETPEYAELAEYFGGLSRLRSNVEAGIVRSIDSTLCARVERRAAEFLDAADITLLGYELGDAAVQTAIRTAGA